jgi:ABC-2 type transport system ATP-binding protein
MMNHGTAVRVRGLEVVRGGRRVLDGVDVDVAPGCVTGLLGPSGCGKSTLIRAVVGVQVIAAGSVDVLGLPAGSSGLRGRVAYLTQASAVYGDLTVRENRSYFAAMLGTPSSEVDRVLDEVDLAAEADQLLSQLSGGQGSRVSLGTALLGRPELLVLDEPTVGLDPVLRRDLWGLFSRLSAAGATLLVSSHVMDEAERCDRLLLMREGELLADWTLPELLERTGAPDVEAAFLSLVEGDRGSAA